eukprot:jgi/Galph1/1412/GphlegSOOS_G105.1
MAEKTYLALHSAVNAGYRRMFVDVDLQQGDPTYTSLKTTLPFLKQLLCIIENEAQMTPTVITLLNLAAIAFN